MKKKITSIILAAIMVTSVAACGKEAVTNKAFIGGNSWKKTRITVVVSE